MTDAEIVQFAQSRTKLPASADSFDQALYYSLCLLYSEFDKGEMPVTIAAIKKKALVEEYKENKQWKAIIIDKVKRMNEINRILDEAEAAGDPYAEKIKRVFYGLVE